MELGIGIGDFYLGILMWDKGWLNYWDYELVLVIEISMWNWGFGDQKLGLGYWIVNWVLGWELG